jgi:hypothetical protein
MPFGPAPSQFARRSRPGLTGAASSTRSTRSPCPHPLKIVGCWDNQPIVLTARGVTFLYPAASLELHHSLSSGDSVEPNPRWSFMTARRAAGLSRGLRAAACSQALAPRWGCTRRDARAAQGLRRSPVHGRRCYAPAEGRGGQRRCAVLQGCRSCQPEGSLRGLGPIQRSFQASSCDLALTVAGPSARSLRPCQHQ